MPHGAQLTTSSWLKIPISASLRTNMALYSRISVSRSMPEMSGGSDLMSASSGFMSGDGEPVQGGIDRQELRNRNQRGPGLVHELAKETDRSEVQRHDCGPDQRRADVGARAGHRRRPATRPLERPRRQNGAVRSVPAPTLWIVRWGRSRGRV